MWILVLIALLLAGHLSLTALVPLQAGGTPPPWWVGGRLFWPFAVESNTLLPKGELLDALTPILGASSGVLFLMAAAALLHWVLPAHWFSWLVVLGAVLSIALQVIWISGWAVLPLLLDAALLWAVLGAQITVTSLRT